MENKENIEMVTIDSDPFEYMKSDPALLGTEISPKTQSQKDQRLPCRFCGSTRSAKIYTPDRNGVQCKDSAGCVNRL
jgi:hypothetical protein